MDVPALYCGVADDVRKVARRQVRTYLRGAPWHVATASPMVSTDAVSGLIYLRPPGMAGAPPRPQIYLYMPFLELFRAVDRGTASPAKLGEVREISLQSDWGSVAMLGGVCTHAFIRDPSCWPNLLSVALMRWEVMQRVGSRYTSLTEEGGPLWAEAAGLHFVIKSLGVRDYPCGRGIVFEPHTFLAEHGLLDRVMAATAHP